jgi:hypothetical protein
MDLKRPSRVKCYERSCYDEGKSGKPTANMLLSLTFRRQLCTPEWAERGTHADPQGSISSVITQRSQSAPRSTCRRFRACDQCSVKRRRASIRAWTKSRSRRRRLRVQVRVPSKPINATVGTAIRSSKRRKSRSSAGGQSGDDIPDARERGGMVACRARPRCSRRRLRPFCRLQRSLVRSFTPLGVGELDDTDRFDQSFNRR